MYEMEKMFQTDLEPRANEPFILYRRKRYIYKLKSEFEAL